MTIKDAAWVMWKRVCEWGEPGKKLYKEGGEQEGFLKQNTRGTTGAKGTENSKQERSPKRV